MRKTLTDKGVAALKPRAETLRFPIRNYAATTSGTAVRSKGLRDGRPRSQRQAGLAHVGAADVLRIDEAREQAREAIKRIKAGLPPIEPPPVKPDLFKAVAETGCSVTSPPSNCAASGKSGAASKCTSFRIGPSATSSASSAATSPSCSTRSRIERQPHGRCRAGLSARHCQLVRRSGRRLCLAVRTRHAPPPRTERGERILDDGELRAVWKAAETNGDFGRWSGCCC